MCPPCAGTCSPSLIKLPQVLLRLGSPGRELGPGTGALASMAHPRAGRDGSLAGHSATAAPASLPGRAVPTKQVTRGGLLYSAPPVPRLTPSALCGSLPVVRKTAPASTRKGFLFPRASPAPAPPGLRLQPPSLPLPASIAPAPPRPAVLAAAAFEKTNIPPPPQPTAPGCDAVPSL